MRIVQKNKIRSAPTKVTIKRLYEKFVSCGNLSNAKRPNKKRPRRSDENISAVRTSVETSPRTSSRRRSAHLGIARTTPRRIIHSDLALYPYKIQVTNKILPEDKPRRMNYAKFVIEIVENDDDFWRRIIMSDEAHFSLNGTVNKQNCRFYATENPQLIDEQPLHDQKVTVWCGICADLIIGPFFFEDDRGRTVTVNNDNYRAMIVDFFMPTLHDNAMDNF